MKMMKTFLLGFLLLLYGCKTSDISSTTSMIETPETSKVDLVFQPMFGNEKLIFNKKYAANLNGNVEDSIKITVLRFYISNIEFYKDNQLIHSVLNSYHLIKLEEPKSLNLALENIGNLDFNTIKFNLGIDSLTNVSGAFGGDLDPTRGMYWTWKSGYINLKIEGTSNLCPTRNQRFQFHLGGYEQPFYALQTIELPIQNKERMVINVNVQSFFEGTDLVTEYSIMSTGADAVKLSKFAAKGFSSAN